MEGTPFIRLLRADEIECRVGAISEKGLSLLLFKDARVDQKILDETFTPFNWKRSHQAIDGNLYCTVEIWDGEKEQWIPKQDVGTMSYSEKEKGQASDSFKRACVNWGIGRELYTAPFIWIPADCAQIVLEKDKKPVTKERFSVRSIEYNDHREICGLEIVNRKGIPVFQMGNVYGNPVEQAKAALEKSSGKQGTSGKGFPNTETALPEELRKELDRTGVALEAVFKRYGLRGIQEMSQEVYASVMRDLKQTRTKHAA